MKRRSFIKTASMGTPIFLNGGSLLAIPKSSLFAGVNPDSDRVLVLIQLNGGNDGLNMMVPLESYDNLANARPSVIIPQSSLLNLSATNGLHPSMSQFLQTYDEGKVAILQGVGYPNQNRSHFRSTDIWITGSSADQFLDTGWVGRYLDTQVDGYPTDYPNEDYPDPFALSIGTFVSETCQGQSANYSLAINSVEQLVTLDEGVGGGPEDDGTYYHDELNFLKGAIRQTNLYGEALTKANDAGSNAGVYPDNELASQLRTVARLIDGGLKTCIYVVTLGGFDTHANQVAGGDTTSGDHSNLLSILSSATRAFQEDLRLLGHEDRVVGMTFSEFGRRIRSNDSLGTDHGSAAPLMVFGTCVNAGIMGDDPVIGTNIDINAGIPMQYDFRSVYGSVLMDWFGVSSNTIMTLLYEDFQYLPIVNQCGVTTDAEDVINADLEVYNYPNPFYGYTRIVFGLLKPERVRLSVFDTVGKEVKVLVSGNLPEGPHEIYMDASNLSSGVYYFRIQAGSSQKVRGMTKV